MTRFCPCGKSNRKEYAKAGAKMGSQLGASAGARVGPFATGLSAGLGGAVGYLAGSAVDTAKGDISAATPIPDGGRPTGDDGAGIAIPVDDESDA